MTPFVTRMLAHFHRIWARVIEFSDITDRRHIFLLASGIAFNLLLCTIPLVILVLSVVSGFVDEELTKATVRGFLRKFLPNNSQASELIGVVIKELGAVFNYGSFAGWIAGAALLWSASTLFSSLRTGLNAIFHIPTPRFFFLYRLKDMALTIVTATLIMLVTLTSPIMTLVETYWMDALSDKTEGIIFGFTARAVSLVSTAVLFFLLYKLVPNKKLPWPIVFMSTGFAIAMWEFARILFSWYVEGATNFSKFYGGYVAITSFALWLYYSAFVFLLAAELGQYIHCLRTEKVAPEV